MRSFCPTWPTTERAKAKEWHALHAACAPVRNGLPLTQCFGGGAVAMGKLYSTVLPQDGLIQLALRVGPNDAATRSAEALRRTETMALAQIGLAVRRSTGSLTFFTRSSSGWKRAASMMTERWPPRNLVCA